MVLFYCKHWTTENAFLTEEESHHCTRVLRKRVGDIVHCTDGKGTLIKGEITVLDKKELQLSIIQSEFEEITKHKLHLVTAPTKNISRMEWLVEKCTEIGIHEFSFVFTKNTERKKLRVDRLEKIAMSATKQSLRRYLPSIHLHATVPTFLSTLSGKEEKFICHFDPQNPDLVQQEWGSESLIFIGPEGDFTKEELTMCLDHGFKACNLSKKRLRTETAAIVATTIFNS